MTRRETGFPNSERCLSLPGQDTRLAKEVEDKEPEAFRGISGNNGVPRDRDLFDMSFHRNSLLLSRIFHQISVAPAHLTPYQALCLPADFDVSRHAVSRRPAQST